MIRRLRIKQIIEDNIKTKFLIVKDVSESHRGHASFKENVESHFEITVVTDEFLNKPQLIRHRIINKLIMDEFLSDLHSVSIKTFTLQEYKKNHLLA